MSADQIRSEYYKTQQNVTGYARDLASATGMFTFPVSLKSWQADFRASMVPGLLLTSILLTLGAPFWYKALSSLIQLRSIAAQKDDQQRAARSAPSGTPGGAPGEAPSKPDTPEWLRGEQGDLAIAG